MLLFMKFDRAIQELAPQLKCVSVFGGTDYQEQISALSGKVDIVCATPGRLRDLMQRKTFVSTLLIHDMIANSRLS